MKKSIFTTLLAAAVLFAGTATYGQTSKGILAGTARDATGAVLGNATVTVTNQDTGETRTVQTQADGGYRVEAITPGAYTVVVTQTGFTKSQVKNLTVNSSSITSYDVTLSVGASNTEVTVEANQATINTENGTLTGVVNSMEIDKLPIFSLNPIELATTVPGVQTVVAGGFSNGINIQVNGARPRANNFLLDGQEINDVGISGQAFQPQIPDIFDSLNVITSAATAEYGRAGGGIVNLVTKQGTNKYHGTVFERYAGSGLNSKPGGDRGPGASDKARFNEHSYGFTAGGPLLKNKLFAFGALELQRFYGKETAGINLLPDAAGYATLQTITGPAAAQVALLDQYLSNGSYLTKDIRYAAVSPAGIFKNVGPLPGCPATGCVITFQGFQRPNQAFSEPDTQWMVRGDYHPWEKDSFSLRYLHDRSSFSPDFGNNGNALNGFDTLQGGPAELAEGNWTHIFSSHLLNEFRVSEARIDFQFAPTPETAANPLSSLATIGFASFSGTTTAGTVGFPALGPNQNFPQGRKEDLYQFQDTVGWIKGRQSFRIGADIGRLIEIDLVSQNAKGTLNFATGGSGVSSLGNFLLNQLGPSGTATKTFGLTRADSHGYRNGFFVQDDIKFGSDMTVNLGVRYDYLSNPENSLPFPGVDINALSNPINTVVKVKNDYNNVSPRIGFAYSPHVQNSFLGNGKTVIRGGFGIFYDSTFSNILVNSTQSSPNAVSGLLTQTTGNGLPNATSQIANITPTLNPLSAVTSEASNLVNPLTYQYNLGIERELPGSVVMSIRYVGNRGEKLFANQQFNYFNGNTGTRLNPARGAINLRGNYADSNYNGLEISGSHNFSHGFLVRANYVFGHDLDNGSDVFAIGLSSPTSYSANLAPGGRRQDWGNSVFDHRQFFSVAYVYAPKGLHSDNAVMNGALGLLTRHWTISGITQLQSGAYSSAAINGLDINGDGSAANDRAVLSNATRPFTSIGIDGAYVGGTSGVYYDLGQLNNNVVATAPASQFHFIVPVGRQNQFLAQEIGRNTILQPGQTTNNLAVEKGIGLSYLHFERGTMLLRVEAQNFANHNDSAIGDTSVLDAGAGFLDTSRIGSNRSLILWAKLQF